MIGPKPFLIGIICGALLLFHVQPSFGIRGHGHEQHSGGESESEPKGVEHLPADDKPGQKEKKEHGHGHHSATEQKGEQPNATETEDSETQREEENKNSEKQKEGKENQHSSGIEGGKLDGKKMFNEVVEKDIAQLKEYLKKHEARQGNEDSDPKKIIENMMEHLKNTEIKCANDNDEEDDKQQPPQYDLKCNHFVEIHKYLFNWLNFLANREEIDKQDYKYLAVRPVVKKQEKGSPEWKEVELKELLDVFKELEKDEPKEVYSFDNLPECHFIKTLVKNLEHGNAKEIKKVKEEIKEIWEKEKDVLCGKGEVFKEEKHNKNLAKHIKEHNKTALVHLIGSPSRQDREMKKGAAEKEKNKGKSAEGNSELEIKGEEEIEEGKEEKLNKKNGEHEKNKKNEEEMEMKEKEEDKEGVGKKVEASESEAASAGSEAVEHPKKVKGAGPEPANGHGHGRTHH